MAKTTREKIINTARKLLWSEGYDGASLNDVVKKAGVSKGALFHYYPSKKSVAREVLDSYSQDQLFRIMDESLKREPTLKAGLFAWLSSLFKTYSDGKFRGGCLLGNFALQLADRDEEFREHIKALFLHWENTLVNALKPEYDAGKVLMEPRQLARLIIAAVEGVMMTSKVHKDNNRASREFQAIGELIERMVKD